MNKVLVDKVIKRVGEQVYLSTQRLYGRGFVFYLTHEPHQVSTLKPFEMRISVGTVDHEHVDINKLDPKIVKSIEGQLKCIEHRFKRTFNTFNKKEHVKYSISREDPSIFFDYTTAMTIRIFDVANEALLILSSLGQRNGTHSYR